MITSADPSTLYLIALLCSQRSEPIGNGTVPQPMSVIIWVRESGANLRVYNEQDTTSGSETYHDDQYACGKAGQEGTYGAPWEQSPCRGRQNLLRSPP